MAFGMSRMWSIDTLAWRTMDRAKRELQRFEKVVSRGAKPDRQAPYVFFFSDSSVTLLLFFLS